MILALKLHILPQLVSKAFDELIPVISDVTRQIDLLCGEARIEFSLGTHRQSVNTETR